MGCSWERRSFHRLTHPFPANPYIGGEICRPKTAVPGMGYFAVCQDTEKNTFALWEINPKAK